MAENSSLWQLYESSEIVLWRRGRIVLVCIGAFYFLVQSSALAAELIAGNLERLLILSIGVTFFWFLFYFVWIGWQWVRWIWGGLNLLAGFIILIWAWRDQNGFEAASAAISLLLGSYLGLAPSVYIFAKRQRETVRWKESLLFGAVCFLILLSIGAAILGLFGYRSQRLEEACALRTKHRNGFTSIMMLIGYGLTLLNIRWNEEDENVWPLFSITPKTTSVKLEESNRLRDWFKSDSAFPSPSKRKQKLFPEPRYRMR